MPINVSLSRLLDERGLRPSPQRVAIFSHLYNNKGKHLTAEEIFDTLTPDYPTLSRTTVYQTLDALCERGLVMRLAVDDGLMRFDAEISHHGHFKCERCKKIFDFFYAKHLTLHPPPLPPEGFLVKGTQFHYIGLCPKCQ